MRPLSRLAGVLVLAATSGSPAFAQPAHIFVNGICGNNSWSGLTPICQAPNGPKRTIQAGINAALNNQIVEVADTTYTGLGNTDLVISGKTITLRSRSGDPTTCIIDCEFASVHGIEIVETPPIPNGSTIDGFTVKRSGVNESGIRIANFVDLSVPEIRNCISTENGRGIFIGDGSTALITNCTISDNTTSPISNGGGILVDPGAIVTIRDCTISGNTAGQEGGGVYCDSGSRTKIVECTIRGNMADGGGGVLVWSNVAGDGVEPGADIVNCRIEDNVATATDGGGVCLKGHPPGSPTVARITNSLIAGNQVPANRSGGGIFNWGAELEVINCTFSGNVAGQGGGYYEAVETGVADVAILNTIMWGDTATNGGSEIFLADTNDVLEVSYSDVQGGLAGVGGGGTPIWTNNIDEDPLFADPDGPDDIPGTDDDDYRLAKMCSPCVDAGDPDDGGAVNASCVIPGVVYQLPCALTCPVPPPATGSIPCDGQDVDEDAVTAEPTPDLRFAGIPNSRDRVLDGSSEPDLDGDRRGDDDAQIDMGTYEFVRPCCPWNCQLLGIGEDPDCVVDQQDLNTLMAQWGAQCVSCDFGLGPAGVGNEDKAALLGHWGSCPLDCECWQTGGASGQASSGELEAALVMMGFADVGAYTTWLLYEASNEEGFAAGMVLLALLGG